MKNVGVPETPLMSADSTSSAIRAAPLRLRSVLVESLLTSSPSSRGVADQVPDRERILVGEQQVGISQNLPCAAAASDASAAICACGWTSLSGR